MGFGDGAGFGDPPGAAPNAISSDAVIPDRQIVIGDGGGRAVTGSPVEIDGAGAIHPPDDLTLELGTAALRFAAVRTRHLLAHNDIGDVVTVPAGRSVAVLAEFGSAYPTEQAVEVKSAGGFVMGNLNKASTGLGTARIEAGATYAEAGAAFVHGSVKADGDNNALMLALLPGAVAMGGVFAYGADATIEAYWSGSYAGGFAATYYGTPSIISALSGGDFAHGYAAEGSIVADGRGATALGLAYGGYDVYASAPGAVAIGAAYVADIEATAQNAQQFGEGTNTLADSMQIGSAGLRLKGTAGAPGAPQNGDFWVASGSVYCRTGGISKKLTDI